MIRNFAAAFAFLASSLLPFDVAHGQEKIQESYRGNIFRPAEEKPSDKLIAGLKLPAGFKIAKFADELEKPRMMAAAPNGDVYVTRGGPAERRLALARSRRRRAGGGTEAGRADEGHHGIAIRDGKIYLTATRDLPVAELKPDGTLGEMKVLYRDLPDAGQHPNRTLAFDKSGELFLSVGSTCDACWEPNKETPRCCV